MQFEVRSDGTGVVLPDAPEYFDELVAEASQCAGMSFAALAQGLVVDDDLWHRKCSLCSPVVNGGSQFFVACVIA